MEEGVGQDWPPMNLTDRRSQLRKYRSRWNHFDRATQETFIIPPAKFRIYQKGYFAYIFRNGSKTTLCARIIRLPSTCNGVTRGEWVFSLEMLPPNVIVQGMTLQPELDLLVVMVSSDQRMCVLTFALVVIALTLLGFRLLDTHMLRLSDGQPHPALPTPETVRAGPGFGIVAAYPCVTRSRLAVLIVNLRPDDWGADMLRGYDLCTGRVVLVQFIQSRLSLCFNLTGGPGRAWGYLPYPFHRRFLVVGSECRPSWRFYSMGYHEPNHPKCAVPTRPHSPISRLSR